VKDPIYKVGALCIREQKLLLVHKKDIDLYITLGGKLKPGESELECLARETQEELGCSVRNPRPFRTFEGMLFDGSRKLIQSCYLVDLEGAFRLNPADSVDGYIWVPRDYDPGQVRVAPMLERQIIPALAQQGLL
jgi:8-oxo-dGTP pyrophosphatase MutT (NUDIX family)